MSTSRVHARILYQPDFLQSKIFSAIKSFTSGSLVGDVAFLVGAVSFLFLLVAFSRVKLAMSFVPGLLLLFALYLVLPFELASGSYVDTRMPIAIAMIGLAGVDAHIQRSAISLALIVLVMVALVVKQVALTSLWHSFDPSIDQMQAKLNMLPFGSIIMQAECQPDARAVVDVYRERQPSMTHLSALAAIDDSRFVASTWVVPGQQPVAIKPALLPYYELQASFGDSTCSDSSYIAELGAIRRLVELQSLQKGAQRSVYFLLIRPPKRGALSREARMFARGPDYEIYEVEAR
jgi:hypothetical protein